MRFRFFHICAVHIGMCIAVSHIPVSAFSQFFLSKQHTWEFVFRGPHFQGQSMTNAP